MSDWNASIIEEFRANGGRVGGTFEGRPLLLLHTKGAKTGRSRVHPLMYQALDGGYAIFASKAGAPSNPAWFHNLMANPEAEIEVGMEKLAVSSLRRVPLRGAVLPMVYAAESVSVSVMVSSGSRI